MHQAQDLAFRQAMAQAPGGSRTGGACRASAILARARRREVRPDI